MAKISMTTETITPEIARQWLEKNRNNRPIRDGHVDALARDMREGRWVLSGNDHLSPRHRRLAEVPAQQQLVQSRRAAAARAVALRRTARTHHLCSRAARRVGCGGRLSARAYYNEWDEYAAAWLRILIDAGHIAPGDVDTRSIVDVRPDDLRGYTQVHFFAGIGGWSLALRLAGVSDDTPVWTGSCPCQPFSAAGKRKGFDDERHLWPEFYRLIEACRPETVFGEQVEAAEVVGTKLEASFVVAVQRGDYARANKLAKRLVASRSFHFHPRWVDGIRADLEAADYALRYGVLGAHSAGAPHIRQRLWWVADAGHEPARGRPAPRQATCGRTLGDVAGCGDAGRMAHADGGLAGDGDVQPGRQHGQQSQDGRVGGLGDAGGEGSGRDARAVPGAQGEGAGGRGAARRVADELIVAGATCGLGDAHHQRSQGWLDGSAEGGRADQWPAGPAGKSGFWSRYDVVHCTDGKARRFEPGSFPLAHGVSNRVGRLRAYGNAINPWLAAEFIKAYLDGVRAAPSPGRCRP